MVSLLNNGHINKCVYACIKESSLQKLHNVA